MLNKAASVDNVLFGIYLIFNIMPFCNMTFNVKLLSIMMPSIISLSIMTFSFMTISIMIDYW
jgi:hypothetical protein